MKEKGSLTIEATLALTFFMFILVFFMGFNNVYRAQSLVSHATMQTAQSLAVNSYFRETVSKEKTVSSVNDLLSFIEKLFGTTIGFNDSFQSLGAGEQILIQQAKKSFITAIAKDEASADSVLKKLGIKDGLAGIKFTGTKIDKSNIYIVVNYSVELPFKLFGKGTINLTKLAVAKSFKSIS